MKKLIYLFAILFVTQLAAKAQLIATITVTTPPEECWVVAISNSESEEADYGWWSVWRAKKENHLFAITCAENNYTVKIPVDAGTYTLIVYRPNLEYTNGGSDGIILEEIMTDIWYDEAWGSSLTYKFESGDFVEWNCLSCPWLYVHDGNNFLKKTEIIKDVVGKDSKQTNLYELEKSSIIDGILKIKIQEEKDETSYLDHIALKVNGVYYPALLTDGSKHNQLLKEDEQYLSLNKGENIELEFQIPSNIIIETVELEASGYYEPSVQYLSEAYQRCLNKK